MKRLHAKLQSLVRQSLLIFIKIYQYAFSPVLGPNCRFYPSCSQYAYKAVSKYGTTRGIWLAIKRICKCHPFHPGGYDPVP